MAERFWALLVRCEAKYEYCYEYSCFYRRIATSIKAFIGVFSPLSFAL